MTAVGVPVALGIQNFYRSILTVPLREGEKGKVPQLERYANKLAQKMGIHKKIELVDTKGHSWAAHGSSFLPGRAGMTVEPGIFREYTIHAVLDKSHKFIIAHELAHIKNDDILWYFIAAVVVSVASFFLLSGVLPILCLDGIAITCFFFHSQHRELQADLEACKHVGDEEKLDFIYWLKAHQEQAKEFREASTRWWDKIRITEEGDSRFGFTHPSHSLRIRKILETMGNRPEKLDLNEYLSKKGCHIVREMPANSWIPPWKKEIDPESLY